MPDLNYFGHLYDDLLLRENGPLAVADAKTKWTAEVVADFNAGTIPDGIDQGMAAADWAELQWHRHIPQMRSSRRKHITAAMFGITESMSRKMREPRGLAEAYPVGDGTDLSLRHWGREHWQNSWLKRLDKAQEAHGAADEFGEAVRPILTAFDATGAAYTWELFTVGVPA